ncbi:MAG: hypothetical protein LBE64_22710 [Acinetobacter pittii]|nr:hypothetical protein [Acinetobacter pittii]
MDEIRHYCPGVKLALVALKCDLRQDPTTRSQLAQAGERPVEYQEVRCAFSLRASRLLSFRERLGSLRHADSQSSRAPSAQGLAMARRIRASLYLGELRTGSFSGK